MAMLKCLSILLLLSGCSAQIWSYFSVNTYTAEKPLRGSWTSPAQVVVSEDTTAQLEFEIEGGKNIPFHIVFFKDDQFFQRITTQKRTVSLETSQPGNYTVRFLWDGDHFPGQAPGASIYNFHEEDDEDNKTNDNDDDNDNANVVGRSFVIVSLRKAPILEVADNFCGSPIVAHVQGVVPLRVSVDGMQDQREQKSHHVGNISMAVKGAGVFTVGLKDKYGSSALPKVVHVHNIPVATMVLRGDANVCFDEHGHLELNLTVGVLPWSFTMRFTPSNKSEPILMHFANITQRVHWIPANYSGKYKLIHVSDAFCEHLHDIERTVGIFPKVKADFETYSHSGCDGDVSMIPVSLEGESPWHVVIERDSFHHRRQILENATCQNGGHCTTFIKMILPGNYRIAEVTDANWCRTEGQSVASVVRYPLPEISVDQMAICAGQVQTVHLMGVAPFKVVYTIFPELYGSPMQQEKHLCHPSNIRQNHTCQWEIPDDAIAGEYVIDSVVDSKGCTRYLAVVHRTSFVVQSVVEAQFIASVNVVCQGRTIDLNAQLTRAFDRPWEAEFEWENVDGVTESWWETATDKRAVTKISRSGKYRLKRARDKRCLTGNVIGNREVEIRALAAPTAKISTVAIPGDCVGSMILLELTGVPPWKVTLSRQSAPSFDVVTENANHTVRVNASGIYRVVNVIDGHHCNGVGLGEASVTLRSPASASWVSPSTSLSFCEGSSASIKIELKGNSPWSLSILRDSQLYRHDIVTSSPFIVDVMEDGMFTMGALLDAQGCAGSVSTQKISVTKRAVPSIAAISSSRVCAGETVSVKFKGAPPFKFVISHSEADKNDTKVVVQSTSYEKLLVLGGETSSLPNPGHYRITSIQDKFCQSNTSSPISVYPSPFLRIDKASAEKLAYGEKVSLFAKLVNGTPPWVAELSSGNGDEKDSPFVIQSRERELLLGNRPGEREWRVLWVRDESGCIAHMDGTGNTVRTVQSHNVVLDINDIKASGSVPTNSEKEMQSSRKK